MGGDIHAPPGDLETAAHVRIQTLSAGLKVLAYGSYYRSESTADPQTDFAPVLATAKELGAPLIRVWGGSLGSRDLTRDGRKALVEHSRTIAAMAQEEGIMIASEYHGGTVTDTPASALQFIGEVDHPNFHSLWQPHVGFTFADARQSLVEILPFVENVHVYHWGITPRERHPLEKGVTDWLGYFKVLKSAGRDFACLLEFVKDDSPDQFLEDAATLKRLVGQA